MSQSRWYGVPLRDGEEVLHEYTPSYLWPGVGFVLFSVVTLGIGFLFMPIHYWAYKQNRWAVTNQRVIARLGVFSKKTISVPKEKITDVTVVRPFMSQVFHSGQVLINTAGSSSRELKIFGQPDPDLVHAQIEEAFGL